MKVYYKDGFYFDDIHSDIPRDAVVITTDYYLCLLQGQDDGKQIVADLNGQPVLIAPQPSAMHELNQATLQWEIPPAKMTALLSEQRATMWARIKQKRHDNLRGGVFVKSVGKWFHTNDESRQQYTFLRTLGNVPQNLMWKTMDNSFVTITKAILDELSLQMIMDEQADFANAERHKALMEQAENPLEYDFSDGWTDIYKE